MTKVAIVSQIDKTSDEIAQYVKARYISASEVIWRLHEYDISGRFPVVNALPIHLPGQDFIIIEGKEKDALKNQFHY